MQLWAARSMSRRAYSRWPRVSTFQVTVTVMVSQDPNAPAGVIGLSSAGEIQLNKRFSESGTYANCTLSQSTFEQGCVLRLPTRLHERHDGPFRL
jgi:hypothetical protein